MKRLLNFLRIFFSGAWLSYVALFYWARPASYIASKVLAPLSQLLFFTYLGILASGPAQARFYIVGNSMQIAALSGIFGVTMTVGRERNEGTLLYLLGSPANRLAIFLGRALFNMLDGVLGVVIGFGWGVLLLGLNMQATNFPGLALTVLITCFSTCGLGLLMGSLSFIFLNVMFLNNTIFFLLLLFSGANLALSTLPAWMQAISYCLPLTRGIQAARLLVAGATLDQTWSLLGGEFLIGVFYTLCGFVLFRWFELQSKKHATLEAF